MNVFKRFIILFAFITIGIALAYNYSHRISLSREFQPELKLLRKIFHEANGFSKEGGKLPHYKVYKGKKPVGFCFLTTDLVPEVKGHGGPIQIMVGTNLERRITGIEILQHNETPERVQAIYEPWFTEQFRRKSAGDKFIIGEDLDGITGATITTTAIAQAVRESVNMMAVEMFQREVSEMKPKKLTPWERGQLFLLAGIFGVAVIGFFQKKRWLRYLTLIVSLIFIGFYKNNALSLVNIINSLTNRFPPLPHGFFWYLFAGLILISTIFWGRFYCGWLCPFGAVEEFLYRRRWKLTSRLSGNVPGSLGRKVRIMKYFLVWSAVILALVLDNVNVSNYEPFSVIFNQTGNTLLVAFLIVLLFLSLFYYRLWCRYFCPVGVVLGIMSFLSIWKLHSNENCVFCRACLNTCPMQAIEVTAKEKIKINTMECIHCNECVRVCKQRALVREYDKKILSGNFSVFVVQNKKLEGC